MSKKQNALKASANVETEIIADMIYIIRGHKVMLDSDLANLYGVETKVLIQSVKRNVERFPEDFMFKLEDQEFECLRSQFVTSKKRKRRSTLFALCFYRTRRRYAFKCS